MIIPKLSNNIRKFRIGDSVILTEDFHRATYMLTRGHELTIIGKDDYGFILEEKELGMIIKNCRGMNFTHKVTLEESKKGYIYLRGEYKFIKFIVDNCPQKNYTFEDRDQVDICNWRKKSEKYKKNYGWKYCKPCADCFQYIPEEKYKDNIFILNYNRKLKLNKIKQCYEQE